ncbi:hypothetical protein J437_LFUL001507 [Ladona fulva]|uniref:Uncharacterized protein n=1 Tax=Ladona fulva TaxID=123851 RepID=A0A8K0JW81_LADFU|nr:hypothetical protein J437_LFUL001507 [Ladona fulva]
MNLLSSYRPTLFLTLLSVFFHRSFTQDVHTCLNCLTSQQDVREITGDVKQQQSFTIHTHAGPENTAENEGFIPAGNTAGNPDFIPVENTARNAGFIPVRNTADNVEGHSQGGSKNTLDNVGFIPMEGQLCPEGHHLVNGECSLIFSSRDELVIVGLYTFRTEIVKPNCSTKNAIEINSK